MWILWIIHYTNNILNWTRQCTPLSRSTVQSSFSVAPAPSCSLHGPSSLSCSSPCATLTQQAHWRCGGLNEPLRSAELNTTRPTATWLYLHWPWLVEPCILRGWTALAMSTVHQTQVQCVPGGIGEKYCHLTTRRFLVHILYNAISMIYLNKVHRACMV